jgi:hypothetical protein
MIRALVLSACLVIVVACGPYAEQSRGMQAGTAGALQEVACQKHIKRFREGAADGLSCEASKKRAAAENPLCPLVFVCPSRDAGAEGGVE